MTKRWKTLKENQNKGLSMVIVLCVSAFFVTFGAAIIYTAGLLTSSSTSRLKQERVYQLSKSYGEIVKKELLKYDKKEDTGALDSLYSFANSFLDNPLYATYDGTEDTKYHFMLESTNLNDKSKSDLPANYGNLAMTLYKDRNDNEQDTLSDGSLQVKSDGSYTSQIESLKKTGIRQYNLYVDVIAYYEDVSYTYSYEFTREETYNLIFTYDSQTIVWDGEHWRYGSSNGSICNPSEGSVINYTYTNETNSSVFKEVKDEGGNS